MLLQILVLAEKNGVRHKTRNDNRKCGELMPMRKEKQKVTESTALDVYENWLARQPVRHVKGKPGFISASGTEATS